MNKYIYIYKERERERKRDVYMHIYIYIYAYIHIYIYIYIYICFPPSVLHALHRSLGERPGSDAKREVEYWILGIMGFNYG